jgi:ADP-heptose:LPS heptosyltransferase
MKILVVRFSSIGDIVLTTPILRCIKQQIPNTELHFLTKQNFLGVIENNRYVDKFFSIVQSVNEVVHSLKNENYDYVIDLHNNLRTFKLKTVLSKKSFSFNKLNWEKFLLVNLKINKLPNKHIIDRFFEAIAPLGIVNDGQGLDYFIQKKDEIHIPSYLPSNFQNGYHALVVGGSYFTKQIPLNKLKEICDMSSFPLTLLGGKEDRGIAEKLQNVFRDKTINLCGELNLNQSASVLQQSQKVITSDTGLMHIAAALKKDIISLWGNTIPEFGMTPYLPGKNSQILEVKELPCRPCSKLGHKKCPKEHFLCMENINLNHIKL